MSNQIVSSKKKLEHTFEIHANWDGTVKYSNKIDIDGFDWAVGVKKVTTSNQNDQKHLAACLVCLKGKNGAAWICVVDARFTLTHSFDNGRQMKKTCRSTSIFKYDKNIEEVIPKEKNSNHNNQMWNNGYDNRSNSKSSVIIRVDFDFVYHNYSISIPNYTDVILKVENVEVHAKKRELYINSEYFDNLFNVQKCDDHIIELDKNIKLSDFLSLLIVMNPKNMFVSSNILQCFKSGEFEKYLELDDRFIVPVIQSKIALAMCMMFELQPKSNNIQDYSEIRLKCLKFADKYGYSNILEHCLNSFESAQEIKAAAKSEDFDVLSSETKAEVLYRVLEFL